MKERPQVVDPERIEPHLRITREPYGGKYAAIYIIEFVGTPQPPIDPDPIGSYLDTLQEMVDAKYPVRAKVRKTIERVRTLFEKK